MKHPRLPDGLLKQMLEDEAAAEAMERTLVPDDPMRQEEVRYSKALKAGTYTLVDKYRLDIEGFKKR